MFYPLMIIGFSSLIFGIIINNMNKTNYSQGNFNKENKLNLHSIEERLNAIEGLLFKNSIDKVILSNTDDQINSDETINIEENFEASNELMNKFEKINKLENDKYSIEEICTILNMNKGEVLLLKNLYKNYPT